VAAAMRVKPGTIKSHLHRAVAALRDRLGTDLEEIPI
jgi:DNA-directed RNA polymerase specialized sigma24 family protein